MTPPTDLIFFVVACAILMPLATYGLFRKVKKKSSAPTKANEKAAAPKPINLFLMEQEQSPQVAEESDNRLIMTIIFMLVLAIILLLGNPTENTTQNEIETTEELIVP